MSQSALLKSKRFLPFFATQFLGAFNDNIYKNTLMLIIAFKASTAFGMSSDTVLNLAAGLFILPFFIFSAIAGQITDKYEKSALMRKIKMAEIVIMLIAAIGFLMEWYSLLLTLLFVMGTQSAFFGPAKYAIIPQHLKSEELVGGNALIGMGTFVAILLGTIGAGIIMQLESFLLVTACSVVIFACLGYITSRSIPVAPSSQADIKISFNPITTTHALIVEARKHRPIYLAIAAISWFWFLGAAYLTQFPNFSKDVLNGDSSLVTLLLAIFTIGVALGSMMCEKLSSSHVELGIVPLGALGLSLFGIDLYFSIPPLTEVTYSWLSFLESSGSIRVLFDLAGIGICGGIFIVPLYSYVQERAEPSFRARTIAVINIMNALFMVGSAITGMIILGVMDLAIPEFFLILSIMNLVVCLYIFSQVDEFAIRFCVWMLSHTLYRVRHKNLENIPRQGAVVVVCNHVSYVDALILAGACRRPMRFVMDHNIFRNRFLGWFFKAVKAIPIAPAHQNEQIFNQAFETISQALNNDEVVCIFPEGKLTRTGDINEFKSGIEKIVERDKVPVVPMALQGLWGSVFSHKDGSAFTKGPKRFWSRVGVIADKPINPVEVNAQVLQQKVQELRGDIR
jgi:1-acyl-sn-glycerol-3-phosphate acyltransferase